jgi:thiol-disulfide isomerase/thioredoxin
MRPIILAAGLTLALIAQSSASPKPKIGEIDPQTRAILKRVERTMHHLQSYQAECDETTTFPSKDGKPTYIREVSLLKAVKPNRLWCSCKRLKYDTITGAWIQDPKDFGIVSACNGKTKWEQIETNYSTDHDTRPQNLREANGAWGGFYRRAASPNGQVQNSYGTGFSVMLLELRRTGRESVDGTLCDKVFDHTLAVEGGASQENWETWYIGADGLVRRLVIRVKLNGEPLLTRDDIVRHIILNKPIPNKVFTYSPPAGVSLEATDDAPEPKLLAKGITAPDFTATDKDGKSVKLSDYQGKVVVIDFWASWCPPCRASMPHNQEVAKKLQAEGLPVVLLAVDNSEERDAFSKWVAKNGPDLSALTFAYVPPATDVAGNLYHVSGIPTQYVIDPKGNITDSFVGYGGPTGDLESAVRAALKKP